MTIMNKKISVVLTATIATVLALAVLVVATPAPALAGVPGTPGKDGNPGQDGQGPNTQLTIRDQSGPTIILSCSYVAAINHTE